MNQSESNIFQLSDHKETEPAPAVEIPNYQRDSITERMQE